MKRLFIIISMVVATSLTFAANGGNEGMTSVAEMEATNPVAGGIFYGTIGGDSDCTLQMPFGSSAGYYSFLNYTRVVRFGSYNAKTRSLVINAYEERTGKYVGKFVGKLTVDRMGIYHYKGVFTNTKGGKVNFDLEKEVHD